MNDCCRENENIKDVQAQYAGANPVLGDHPELLGESFFRLECKVCGNKTSDVLKDKHSPDVGMELATNEFKAMRNTGDHNSNIRLNSIYELNNQGN